MNIDSIRDTLKSFLHVRRRFYYVGLRGQNEEFSGEIIHLYSRTFLVLTDQGTLKSFSYSDFATKTLKILR